MTIQVTLDTNCFFEYFIRDPKHIKKLIAFSEDGDIELAMTTRVMADTYDKSKSPGISLIWQQIQSFPQLETIGTCFRHDSSRLDSGDYLVSDENVKTIDQIESLMPEAQTEDIDHLFGHINSGRDIFISSDNHFLNNKEKLNNEFGVVILDPENSLIEIERRLSSSKITNT
jgi:hypothetical protein